ncbi:MAG: IPT/TIG domain-containing protein [bacterium]|nr:IPT/TIG domain-containing protein [bacterium]
MKFLGIFFVAVLVFPNVVFGATFTRTLSLGMRGDDVRALQVFLNTDSDTRVAESGVGSVGNETSYFGAGTKRGLVKFQEKYRAEILTPNGLPFGTGIFGPKTREKIKALTIGAPATNIPLKELPTLAVEKGKVVVMFPSQYSAKPGTTISISGAGFTPKDNTVYFGADHAVSWATSWNGQSISLKVPEIPKGVYPLFVKNARGESNKDAFFIVTDGVTAGPKIESVLPTAVSTGDTVVVIGSGFLSTGNTMMVAGIGAFKNVSSIDGATMSFVIPKNLFNNATSTPKIKNFSIPVSVYIMNENGVSNAKPFSLKLL